MNTRKKYDPEDIESLMMHKSFAELLDDEKEFVLQHLASGQEYDELRTTLFRSIESMKSDNLAPPSELKRKVMAQYRAQHEGIGFGRIWLNIVGTIAGFLREKPYVTLATAAVLLFLGVFFWIEPLNKPEVAVQQKPDLRMEQPGTADNSVQEESPEEPYEVAESVSGDEQAQGESASQEKATAVEASEYVAEASDLEEQEVSESEADVQSYARSGNSATPETTQKMLDINVLNEESAAQPVSAMAASGLNAEAEDVTPEERMNFVNEEFLALLYTAR